ncbi:hypothetical protein C8R44DRAFT_951934 [Mycena epipterygia]|nr:hypothetical protein C8R44DRAFT_951934 [Mycena epipterygia]
MDLNHPFFETDKLPEGTYLATGLSGVTLLAEYLDANPNTKITQLLLSDWTIQDLTYLHLCDNETMLRINCSVRDIAVSLWRILDKAAPSLEALSYLAHIPYARLDEKPDDADARITALLGRSYPSLTQLTFRNNHMHGAPRVLGHRPLHFPALTHLHVDADQDELPWTLESLRADFPHLTHLRIAGAKRITEQLCPNSRMLDHVEQAVLSIPPLSILENFTVIIDPGCRGSAFCETPRVHMRLFPTEEDYQSESYLRRTITEFIYRARGSEGEWAIPEPVSGWWNKPSDEQKADGRDESDLLARCRTYQSEFPAPKNDVYHE